MKLEKQRDFKPGLTYNRLTPIYDSFVSALGFGTAFRRSIVDILDLQGGESVLDVACGTGTVLALLAQQGRASRLVGVDADAAMLRQARGRLPHDVELTQTFAQHLPFESDTFDVVVSTMAFHHLADPAKRDVIRDVDRVLRDGGRFVLVDFGRPHNIIEWVLLHAGSLFDGRRNMRANLAGELPSMLADAGFEVDEVGESHHGVRFLMAR